MITLALQIFFGVRAFRNGWRWRVAYPFVVWSVTAFLLGVASALQGQDLTAYLPMLIIMDIALISVLAHMSKHAPAVYARIVHAAQPEAETAALG